MVIEFIDIFLLIKTNLKLSMGWLIALDEPVFNKPTKPKKPTNAEYRYDYIT